VHHHLIGPLDLPQGAPLPTRLTAGLAPDRPRSDFGAGLPNSSLDGGFDELREEAASCRSSSAIRASCSAIRACNATTRAASCS
jgi:hypothetical protein